jgi:hypothetical protein
MKSLREAYQIVDAVSSHAGLLCSQFVRTEVSPKCLTMNLTGLALAEASVVGGDISVEKEKVIPKKILYLDRRLFGGFLSAHPRAESMSFRIADEQVILRCGSHQLSISNAEISGYQTWKPSEAKPLTLRKAELQQLTLLRDYVSDTSAADHLNAIRLVSKYGAIATDSFAMAAVLDSETRLKGFFPSLLPRLISGEPKAVIEPGGVGILFPIGYLYQPISENCLKSFPEKQLRVIISQVSEAGYLVAFPLKTLREVLSQLTAFIFGGTELQTALIQCQAGAAGTCLSLKLPQGVTQRTLKIPVAKEFQMQWSVKHLMPWIQGLPDGVETVECLKLDFGTAFRAAWEGRIYLLMVAEIAGA